MSGGRRTLKANLGRLCTMCQEDPRLFGQPVKPERIPHYHPEDPSKRLMVCPIHDRPPMTIRTT